MEALFNQVSSHHNIHFCVRFWPHQAILRGSSYNHVTFISPCLFFSRKFVASHILHVHIANGSTTTITHSECTTAQMTFPYTSWPQYGRLWIFCNFRRWLFSLFLALYIIKHRFDVIDIYLNFIKRIAIQFSKTIKILNFKNAMEYEQLDFIGLLNGHHCFCPTSQ